MVTDPVNCCVSVDFVPNILLPDAYAIELVIVTTLRFVTWIEDAVT